jgi:hypothetical protein
MLPLCSGGSSPGVVHAEEKDARGVRGEQAIRDCEASVGFIPRSGSVELEMPSLHMTELADSRASDLASRRIEVQRLTREMC